MKGWGFERHTWSAVAGALLLAVGGSWPGPGSSAVHAQTTVGVQGGVTGATIAWSPTPLGDRFEGLERRRGPTGALWVAVPLGAGWGVRLEAGYTEKGFVERTEARTTTLAQGYLEVPALLTWEFATGGPLAPALYAGPWAAWEATCDVALDSATLEASYPCEDIPDDPVLRQRLDWGLALGSRLRFSGGGRWIGLVDLRYSRGLRNVDGSPAVDNFEIRHRGVAVSVGVGFRMGR